MSDMQLTEEELAALPAKTKVEREVVELYLNHPFMEAYALHTEHRMKDGYKGAVGPADRWDELGNAHLNWLKSQGLQPHHMLLDFGCGTGRLARRVVPYLYDLKYVGVDVSGGALRTAAELGLREGWYTGKYPTFAAYGMSGRLCEMETTFDFVWAFSVFIHNPYEIMASSMQDIAEVLKPDGKFYFSWTNEKKDERTGLKQFRHTRETYEQACDEAGLTFEDCKGWDGDQKMAVARHK